MSFCGLCGSRSDYDDRDRDVEAGERRPLLAQGHDDADGYNAGSADETDHQRRLHQKLHSYQMARALADGYLPSTAQTVANLRRLAPEQAASARRQHTHSRGGHGLSASGHALSRLSSRWLEQLIVLLQHKNGDDQIQDFVWCLLRARLDIDVDVGDVADRVARRAGQASAHTSAAYRSLQTIGTLLLTNPPFRLFMADLTSVGRDVFRDTALSLADASRQAAKNVQTSGGGEPSEATTTAAAADDTLPQAQENVAAVTDEVTAGASKVAAEAQQSFAAKLGDNSDDDGNARERLLSRLKEAVGTLRQRPDYAESVSVLTVLLQRYAAGYVHAAEEVVEEVVDEVRQIGGEEEGGAVRTNDEADAALRNFWSFLTAFGDAAEWQRLEARFKALLDRSRGDNQRVDSFLREIGQTLEALLTDPAFFDDVEGRLGSLKKQADELEKEGEESSSTGTSIRGDIDAFFAQAKTTLQSVADDRDVTGLVATTTHIADLLWPSAKDAYVNTDLLGDAVSVFVPRLIQAVQFVPIPRLEVVSPDVDLLLEGLVLEPGRHADVHSSSSSAPSSFLPYRLQVQIRNDVDVRKTQVGAIHGTASSVTTAATIHIRGLSVAADDFGYVLRVHAGPFFRFSDEGIASFHLDERGVDVRLDVDVVRDAADRMLSLRGVHVRIHHLQFSLRRSKVAWLTWLLTPLLRPLLRKTLERQIAVSVRESLNTLNQELVFARERLRAARIASGGSSNGIAGILPVLRAVFARFQPSSSSSPQDPDVDVSIGFEEGATGVFDGVYAPGSLVRVWREEALAAEARIDEEAAAGSYERGGWRNGIFDVPAAGDPNGGVV